MSGHVDSTSDARTVNNTMRHAYRVLSDDEKVQMELLKDLGQELWDHLDSLLAPTCSGGFTITRADVVGREIALAKTKVEEAVMWGVKAITK